MIDYIYHIKISKEEKSSDYRWLKRALYKIKKHSLFLKNFFQEMTTDECLLNIKNIMP